MPRRRLDPAERSDNVEQAKEKALWYLGLRDHASGELYQKLCERFLPETAAAAVARLVEVELVNDAAFARHRARYLAGLHKSRREIARQLTQKGVGSAETEAALAELYDEAEDGENPELEAALALVQKSYARKLMQGKREAVVGALCRRGFSLSTVREALSVFEEQNQNENDWNEL